LIIDSDAHDLVQTTLQWKDPAGLRGRCSAHLIAASFNSGSVRFTSREYVTRHQHMRFAEVDHTFECNSLLVWVSDVPACIIADIDLLEISV
jgi:hypothetical protein